MVKILATVAVTLVCALVVSDAQAQYRDRDGDGRRDMRNRRERVIIVPRESRRDYRYDDRRYIRPRCKVRVAGECIVR